MHDVVTGLAALAKASAGEPWRGWPISADPLGRRRLNGAGTALSI